MQIKMKDFFISVHTHKLMISFALVRLNRNNAQVKMNDN
jgi:hypothetical protein